MSTDALVVAGTALAVSLRGTQRPHIVVLLTAVGALLLVFASVTFASMALVLLPRGKHFNTPLDDASALYIYTQIGEVWPTFDAFKDAVDNQSPEQQLRGAVFELWRISQLHRYRVQKLRASVWCLLAALGLLMTTVTLSAGLR